MIVDSSAVVAIAIGEPEQECFIKAINAARHRRMSAGTWVELAAVATRKGLIAPASLDAFLTDYEITIEPVTLEQARIGHAAYRKFGLGTRHAARLNFGDCFSYALAKDTGEPLLFKGDDFGHTDVIDASRESSRGRDD